MPRTAERKQSLGYDWHPECLRCEECGKRLNPGQHAEVSGITCWSYNLYKQSFYSSTKVCPTAMCPAMEPCLDPSCLAMAPVWSPTRATG